MVEIAFSPPRGVRQAHRHVGIGRYFAFTVFALICVVIGKIDSQIARELEGGGGKVAEAVIVEVGQ